ncbi:MAG: hypothetical protein MnENMB40S_12160 [Rhizobiaceae bacterium MnEN-MB40S]|nr:MAG: hypothetical protein MnENMB40S_12160 [Rhizobiaceae bacterium MnEN-MB40S]
MYRTKTVTAHGIFTAVLLGSSILTHSLSLAGGRETLNAPHPWDFPDRSRDAALAFQLARDNDEGLAAAAGIAASTGSPIVINSTSTAVGNWQQIEMTLGDGAEGMIMTENHQDNSGNTSAVSDVMNDSNLSVSNGNRGPSAVRSISQETGERQAGRPQRDFNRRPPLRRRPLIEKPTPKPMDHHWKQASNRSHKYDIDHRIETSGTQGDNNSNFDWGTSR